jgi:hypothetical protein
LEAKYFQEDPLMAAIEELPLPTEKSVNTATAEFVNWDWSSTHF